MSKEEPLVLHLTEMVNGENNAVKVKSLEDVAEHCSVGIYCHDCACRLGNTTIPYYCEHYFLDKWHAKGHICSKALYDPAHPSNAGMFVGLNTSAAEQLWGPMNKLHFCPRSTRPKYRMFLRHYLRWRNDFLRSKGHRDNANPRVGKKKWAKRH